MSLCNCVISSSFFIDRQSFVSSAYSAMCVSVLMPSCKSFMNKTKSMGPKMDPWGTPDRTGFKEDLTPSNTTLCSRSQR